MGWKIFFSLIFILFVIALLVFYWFIPTETIRFQSKELNGNTNFSLDNNPKSMQFYENMRYPEPKISYKINNCPLQKKNDVQRAFEIISDKTILEFYETNLNEDIFVTCGGKNKIEQGLFIAGEGGPTNITQTDLFNIILHGKILLIRDSSCPEPNVAIHELLHALGFDHSPNPNNIMYNISNCKQTIGQDTTNLINDIYSVKSLPELLFTNVSATIHGVYLDTEIEIRNHGLKSSENAEVIIYIKDKEIKKINLKPLEIGYGWKIKLSNIWISKKNVEQINFVIDTDFEELDKGNNEIVLKT